MHGMKTIMRSGAGAALVAAGIVLAGCAATFNHAYDPAASYEGFKSYGWAEGSAGLTQDIVAKNVRYHADRVLEKKGFRRTAENPDLLFPSSTKRDRDQRVRVPAADAELVIQKADGRQAIWRGTATGSISADRPRAT